MKLNSNSVSKKTSLTWYNVYWGSAYLSGQPIQREFGFETLILSLFSACKKKY